MNLKTLFITCVILFLCCVAGLAQGETVITNGQPTSSPTNNSASATLADTPATPEQTSKLETRLKAYYTDYRNAQWRFSWAYHICIYGAAILSALAALLTKVKVKRFGLNVRTRKDNWIATSAASATLLIAISTAGNLQKSWQDNMTRRYAVEKLLNLLRADQKLSAKELEDYGKSLADITDPNFVSAK